MSTLLTVKKNIFILLSKFWSTNSSGEFVSVSMYIYTHWFHRNLCAFHIVIFTKWQISMSRGTCLHSFSESVGWNSVLIYLIYQQKGFSYIYACRHLSNFLRTLDLFTQVGRHSMNYMLEQKEKLLLWYHAQRCRTIIIKNCSTVGSNLRSRFNWDPS